MLVLFFVVDARQVSPTPTALLQSRVPAQPLSHDFISQAVVLLQVPDRLTVLLFGLLKKEADKNVRLRDHSRGGTETD